MNEYGTESLTQLTLGSAGNKLWPYLTLPFKKVETLFIGMRTDTDGMKLNQMCPNLKVLRAWFYTDANYDFIDCELPHLDYLEVFFVNRSTAWNREKQITSFIKKNPQIRSVDAQLTGPEFVKMINEQLPYLQNLKFAFDDNRNGPTHFENVKHCTLRTSSRSTIRNLTFSNLESLEIDYNFRYQEKFTDFFRRHSNLTKLRMRLIWDAFVDLDNFTAELANLTEMFLIVRCHYSIDIQTLTRFIENHPKLMKIQFPAYSNDETNRKHVHEKFGMEWNIKHIIDLGQTGAFEMERKTEM